PAESKIADLCVELGIWNRIENDFVLMVGLLPFVPSFIKSCTQLTKTHLSSTGQRFKGSQYSSLGYQKQGSRTNDTAQFELTAHAQEPPGLDDDGMSSPNRLVKEHRGRMANPSNGYY